MADFHPLPETFPVVQIIAAVRDIKKKKQTGARAVWHGAGYGINKLVKDDEPILGLTAQEEKDLDLLCDRALAVLESTGRSVGAETEGGVAAGAITIETVMSVLIPILLKIWPILNK
jgi:hypothetical protein